MTVSAAPQPAEEMQLNIPDNRIMGSTLSPAKMAKVDEQPAVEEWIPFGTASFNDAFNQIFKSDYTADKPLDVQLCVTSDYEWKLKIVGLLGSDIIVNSHLRLGHMNIDDQQTTISNPYHQEEGDGYYPCYSLYMDEIDANPFEGTINLPIYALVSASQGYDFRANGCTMTLKIGKEWQHFGTATPNEGLINAAQIYNATVEAKDHEVDYIKLSEKLWIFMLHDFIGSELPIVSYIDRRVSVAVNTPTNIANSYYSEDSEDYKTYHLTSYFAGSPRDGQMWFPFWLLVNQYNGFNINRSDMYVSFKSDLISSFNVTDTEFIIGDSDNGKVTLNVERSDNVVQALVEVIYSSYKYETSTNSNDIIFSDKVDIADDNTITVSVGKGRGYYYIRTFGLDSDGPFGTQKNIFVYSNTGDGHTWQSIGTGLFKPVSFSGFWNGHAPWLEVEIEKASDAEGLYRAVNPYKVDAILGQTGDTATYYDKMNSYIYFGENNDYTIKQHSGLCYKSGGFNILAVYPTAAYNPSTGIYDLSIGEFTLPGIKNYGIELISPNSAITSPHVKDVVYTVVPSSATIEHNLGTDARAWLESGVSAVNHATPDSENKVTFDNSSCTGNVHLIAAASVDDKSEKQVCIHSLISEGEGWIETGEFDVTPFVHYFTENVQAENSWSAVSINPFDRMIVKLDNPFKCLDGQVETSEYTTDFSVDRSIYFNTSPAGFVYSCDNGGNVLEVGGETGIFSIYDGDTSNYSPEELARITSINFQTETNVMYRSGYTDNIIAELLQNNPSFAVPVRYGSLLVFPDARAQLYCITSVYFFLPEFFIFAPADASLDFTIAKTDNKDIRFKVGKDISAVEFHYTALGEEHPSLYDILHKDIQGSDLIISEGEATADIPVGSYTYTAIAYDKDGAVANCLKGEADVTSGIFDISAADEDIPGVYYNLQGIEVSEPIEGGIYIVRRGNKVTKEIVR